MNILDEKPFPLRQAAGLIPPSHTNKPVSLSCLIRWVVTGVKGPNGSRVRLEAVRFGGRWLTSSPALERFVAALTPNFNPDSDPKPTSSKSKRRRERPGVRAGLELEKAGIGV